MAKGSNSTSEKLGAESYRADVQLDDIDMEIVRALRENGRIANRELAERLGVNEATVRSRLRKLSENDIVRVIATRDIGKMGFGALAAVGVQVKGRPAKDVGQDLAKLAEVVTVNASIGMYDLEMQVIARDLAELDHLLTKVIAPIDGVERLFPGLALKVVKFNSNWSPL